MSYLGQRAKCRYNWQDLEFWGLKMIFYKVYAIWMEWLAGLAPDVRDKVSHFMYDDMCHLRVNFYVQLKL